MLPFALMQPLPAKAEQDLEQARREMSRITERLNDLGRWFNRAERQEIAWQRELQQVDGEIDSTRNRIRRVEAEARELQTELDRLTAEGARLAGERDAQARRIGEHLGAAARLSGEDFFKLLLNQEDPAELDRIMRYHRYFSEARLESLQDFQATLTELQANTAQTETRRSELQAQIDRLRDSERELSAQRRERERLLAQLAEDRQDREKERERLTADQARLGELIAELSRRTQVLDGSAFRSSRGSLAWPIDGELVSRFGQSRSGGRLRWQGLFIEADEGTAVRAVYRGQVAFADWLRGFGLLTIVDHGDGQMSLYAHADTLYKRVGDWVEVGETIAAAGRSGGQDRSGLYFEIRVNGQAQDPGNWLRRR
jgi:murein hydrolase activator